MDVDHDLNSGWDWDDEGPPLGEMEWDEGGVTTALAAQSVAAARAALDADPGLERGSLDGMVRLDLEIHPPGRSVTTYDLPTT
ncbi:hypothetical protein [Streptomyces javensis]|uniref:Uncharacterized protein n=1 Tax=Streptomyces javensis TaxID=114698 RepID=A0ABS0RIF6_9ACTN|nr:hypothetical protein [Streptomyces javensis]MBI0316898.1 hypothetical protein [Streptomyces javensis]